MKKYILFLGIIALMFFLMYLANKNSPPKFQWKPTYSTKDKQPYGSFVFDKIMTKSWEKGYSHSYESITDLYNYYDDEEIEEKAILVVCDFFDIPLYEIDDFFDCIISGTSVFVAADYFGRTLSDSLGFSLGGDFYSTFDFPFLQEKKTVFFHNSVSQDSIYGIPRAMINNYLGMAPKALKTFRFEEYSVAVNNKNQDIIRRYAIGEGELYLCHTPLLFTNYSILNDSTNLFVRQALAPLKDKPLIRTEYYGKERSSDTEKTSPFRYILSQPSLKWAYYIVVVCVILFMIFTARRKQKIIPIVKPPKNKMLDFVRSISVLYLKRNNNADIVLKKYSYWCDEIRRKYGVDVVNEEHNKHFIKQFSAKTGMPEEETRTLFLELDGIREHTFVSDEEMMDLITKMKID